MDIATERVKIPPFILNFFYPIPVGLSILILRTLLEKFCFEPVGVKLGIKPLVVYPKEKTLKKTISILEWLPLIKIYSKVYDLGTYFKFTGNFSTQKILKIQKLTKFCKSLWQFTFYIFTFISGMVIVWNKPWFWNIDDCWTNFRNQKLTDDVWAYNVMNLGFYWSLLITVLLGTRKKDFHENMIHHSVAILLIYLSVNFQCFRIGTIVLVDLSVSDIFLEASKLAKYLKYNKTCTACFISFTIMWVISRLIVFPFWIIKNTLFHVPIVLPMIVLEWYLLNGLLLLLVVLNFFWTNMIFKVLWRGLTQGDLEDVRSDSENDS